MPMFFKFFCVQKILDALFDEHWCSLCLPEGDDAMDVALAEFT